MADHPLAFVGPDLTALEVDVGPTFRTFDPELQMWVDRPLRQAPYEDVTGHFCPSKWHHDRHIFDLKRNIESCDHRLAHFEDKTPWWLGDPPISEQLARKRTELENERAAVLAELERMGPIEPEPKSRKPRAASRGPARR